MVYLLIFCGVGRGGSCTGSGVSWQNDSSIKSKFLSRSQNYIYVHFEHYFLRHQHLLHLYLQSQPLRKLILELWNFLLSEIPEIAKRSEHELLSSYYSSDLFIHALMENTRSTWQAVLSHSLSQISDRRRSGREQRRGPFNNLIKFIFSKILDDVYWSRRRLGDKEKLFLNREESEKLNNGRIVEWNSRQRTEKKWILQKLTTKQEKRCCFAQKQSSIWKWILICEMMMLPLLGICSESGLVHGIILRRIHCGKRKEWNFNETIFLEDLCRSY